MLTLLHVNLTQPNDDHIFVFSRSLHSALTLLIAGDNIIIETRAEMYIFRFSVSHLKDKIKLSQREIELFDFLKRFLV